MVNAASGWRPAEGDTLEEAWRLDERLRSSPTGELFSATDLRLGRKVVVKVVGGKAADPDLLARFERETQLLVQLDHRNLVSVHGAGRHLGVPYLVMQFVEGRSLASALARGPLSPKVVLGVTRQICAALDHLHLNGVLHRDLKPANVMVGQKGHVTLVDLGLARPRESGLTRTGVVHGTPGYLAPEQIVGEVAVDGRADLYALGSLLYEMLTGQRPFADRADDALVRAHLMEPRPALRAVRPELPAELEPVVAKAMAIRPEERYSTAGALLAALEPAAAATAPRRPSVELPTQKQEALPRPAAETRPLSPLAPPGAVRKGQAESSALGDADDPTGQVAAMEFSAQEAAGEEHDATLPLAEAEPDSEEHDATLPLGKAEVAAVAARRLELRADPGGEGNEEDRAGRRLAAWFLGAATVLAVVGALVALLWHGEPAGPLPPQPLATRVVGMEVPVSAPAAAEPLVVVAQLPSDMAARQAAIQVVEERPKPAPNLRSKQQGMPPKKILRKDRGASPHRNQVQLQVKAVVGKREINAHVVVNDQWRGKTPLSVALPPGDHLVRIDHPGMPVSEFVATLLPFENAQYEVELRSAAEAAAALRLNRPGRTHNH